MLNIFVLEDEIDLAPRNAILGALRGHRVNVARSAEDAIKRYPLYQPYDLILLDHDMEGFFERRPDYPNTGYQFVKWLCSAPQIGHDDDPAILLHSHHAWGVERMMELLNQEAFRVIGWHSYDGGPYLERLATEVARLEAAKKA